MIESSVATKTIKTEELKPHEKNNYYFDDMDGEKWQEFLKSIKEYGVINPPVITEDGRIISGHQRVRACKELGITEIECTVKHFASAEEEEIALIESNLRQRGVINSPSVKLGRILTTLERSKGAEANKPSGRYKAAREMRKELYNKLHIDRKTACRARGLAGMPDKLQSMTEHRAINATTAYEEIIKLSQQDQAELAKRLIEGESYTKAEIKAIIRALPDEEQLAALERRITEAHRQRDDTELSLREKLQETQRRERITYESLQRERKAHKRTVINCEQRMDKQEQYITEYLRQTDAEVIEGACKALVIALKPIIERAEAIDSKALNHIQSALEALEAVRQNIETDIEMGAAV